MLIVTHAELKRMSACEEERKLFRRYATHGVFRRSVQFETLGSLTNWCLKHRTHFNWSWAAFRLMSDGVYARYRDENRYRYRTEPEVAVSFAEHLWQSKALL